MKKPKEIYMPKLAEASLLQPYIEPTYNMIVIINAYEKFWGPVEVIEPLVNNFITNDGNHTRCIFFSVDKDFNPELWGKHVFTSRPAFFIFHRGTLLEVVDGLDFPKLLELVEKRVPLLSA